MSYFKTILLSNQFFPLVKVKLGTQKITLWITKGIKTKTVRQAFEKSFYTKQKKLQQLKESIWVCKTMATKITTYSKKYDMKKMYMIWYKNDMKKTWIIMKEIIGKNTKYETHLARKIAINKEEMNKRSSRNSSWIQYSFKHAAPKLASEIPNPSNPFESFMKQVDATATTHFSSINKLKDAFFL